MGTSQLDISDDVIRMRSYLIWEREGRPQGHAMGHWLQAKAELEAAMRGDPPPQFPVTVVQPRVPISKSPRRRTASKIPKTPVTASSAARK